MVEDNDEASSSEEEVSDALGDVDLVGGPGVGYLGYDLLLLGTRRG